VRCAPECHAPENGCVQMLSAKPPTFGQSQMNSAARELVLILFQSGDKDRLSFVSKPKSKEIKSEINKNG